MQTRIWDYMAPDSTQTMVAVLARLFRQIDAGSSASGSNKAGRITGFICTANAVPDEFANLELGQSVYSSVMTNDGVVVTEDDDLDDAVTFANMEANPRIDIVAVKHQYTDALPNVAATYKVVKGVAAVTPTPPYTLLASDEVPLAEVYIAAGAGAPSVADTDIRVLPSCVGMLIAEAERTFGRTDNAAGDAGIWMRGGRNTDRFYLMRDPEDDQRVYMALNAYFDPTNSQWSQEDVARRSLLLAQSDVAGASQYLFSIYVAEPGTASAAFASFWTVLFRVREDGYLDYAYAPPRYTSELIFNVTDTTVITPVVGSCGWPTVAENENGVVFLAYIDDCLVPPGATLYKLYYRSSSDGGLTWSGPVMLHGGGINNRNYYPFLAPMGSSDFMLVWVRDVVGVPTIYANKYTGGAWAGEAAVDAVSIVNTPISVAELYNGDLLCAYVASNAGVDTIYTNKYTGGAWAGRVLACAPVNPADDLRSAFIYTHPDLLVTVGGVTRRRVYLIYANLAGANYTILLRYSDDDGATWSAPINIESNNCSAVMSHSLFYNPHADELLAIFCPTATPGVYTYPTILEALNYKTCANPLGAPPAFSATPIYIYNWSKPAGVYLAHDAAILTKAGHVLMAYSYISGGHFAHVARGNIFITYPRQ